MESELERAWEMTKDLEVHLTGCQVGITACSILLGIVAEPALAAVFEPLFGGTVLAGIGLGTLLAFIIISLLHLGYGEQTPTYLGVERSKQVCRYGVSPLYWWTRLIWPILRFGDVVAKWTLQLFGIEMTGANPKPTRSRAGGICTASSNQCSTRVTSPTTDVKK